MFISPLSPQLSVAAVVVAFAGFSLARGARSIHRMRKR